MLSKCKSRIKRRRKLYYLQNRQAQHVPMDIRVIYSTTVPPVEADLANRFCHRPREDYKPD